MKTSTWPVSCGTTRMSSGEFFAVNPPSLWMNLKMFVHPALLFLKIPMFASSNSLVIAKNPARVCPRIISPIIMFAIEVASILLRINLKEKLEKAIAFTPQTSSFRMSSFRNNKSPDPLLGVHIYIFFHLIPEAKLLIGEANPSSIIGGSQGTSTHGQLHLRGAVIQFRGDSIGIPYTNGPPKL